MDKFVHNGVTLEYEVSGTGIPFVFLHGMGGSGEQIRSVYEPVRGVRLISMNQQGHGNSGVDWDNYDFDHLGDDVIALLDHIGVERAVLGGISMGAAVGLNAAVRYPKRVLKLLLIRNAWTDHPMPEDVRTAYHDLGHALQKGSIEEFYASKGWGIVRGTTEYTRHAFTGTFGDLACLRYWQKYLILPDKTPISGTDALKRLTMPVTILACRNDLCHPCEYGSYLAGQIAGASLLEIPDKDTDGPAHKRMINEAIRGVFEEGQLC